MAFPETLDEDSLTEHAAKLIDAGRSKEHVQAFFKAARQARSEVAPAADAGLVGRAWNALDLSNPEATAAMGRGAGAIAGAAGKVYEAVKPPDKSASGMTEDWIMENAAKMIDAGAPKPAVVDFIKRSRQGRQDLEVKSEVMAGPLDAGLGAAGAAWQAISPDEPGAPEKGGFQRLAENLDRPGNAVRNALERAASGTLEKTGGVGSALMEGLARDRVVTGQQMDTSMQKAGWVHPDPGIAAGMKYLFGDYGKPITDVATGVALDVATDPLTYLTMGASASGKAAKSVTTAARDARLFGRAPVIEEGSVLGRALAKMSPEAQAAARAGESLSTVQAIREGQTGVRFMGLPVLPRRVQASIASGMGRMADAVAGTENAREIAKWANRLFGSELGLTNAERDLRRMDYFSRQEALQKMAQIKNAASAERRIFDDTARRLGIDTGTRNRQLTDIWEKGEIEDAFHYGRIDEEEYKVLKRYQERTPEQLKEAQAAGINITGLVSKEGLEYVHHLMSDKRVLEWINANVDGPDLTTKVQRFLGSLEKKGDPGFAKKRLIDRSISDQNAAAFERGMPFKMLEDDPAVVFAAREMAQVKAIGAAGLLDRIKGVFSVAAPTLGGGKDSLSVKAAIKLAEERAARAAAAHAGVTVRDLAPATARDLHAPTISEATISDITARSMTVPDMATLPDAGARLAAKGAAARAAADDLARLRSLGEDMIIVRDGPLRGRAVPRDVYDFTVAYSNASKPAEMSKALRAFDAVQSWWAMWTLAPRPAFHFRNGIGNLWNNALAGIYSPTHYLRAGTIQMGAAKPHLLEGKAIRTAAGVEIPYTDVRKLGLALGIDKSNQFRGNVQTLKQEIAPVSGWQRVNPLSREAAPIKLGAMAGEVVEGNARWAHFIAKLEEGMSPEAAAMSVKKYLFDYQELTDFERRVMKRVIPFWSWSRNNVPLQLEALRKNPGRFARFQQVKQEIEYQLPGGPVPDEAMPEWSRGEFPIQTLRKGNTVGFRVLKNWFPSMDIGPLFGGAKELTGEVAGKLSPVLVKPFEAAINTDLRRSAQRGERVRIDAGTPAELLGGRLDPRIAHGVRALATIAAIDTLNPGEIFGAPRSEERPDGAPAKVNLLAPFGAPRAEVRLRQDQPQADRFTTFGTGLRGYMADMDKEQLSQIISLQNEQRRLEGERRRAANRNDELGMTETERLLRENRKAIERVVATFDKARR